jgi:hypothetical protein
MHPNHEEKDNDALVVTPGGPRPKDQVHQVPEGGTVQFDTDGRSEVRDGRSASSLRPGLVLTPGGYREGSRVHALPPGSFLVGSAEGIHLLDEAGEEVAFTTFAEKSLEDAPVLGSGWISYAYWNNGTGRPIESFRSTWTVPAPPQAQSRQTIFLFNGIQNYGANFGILQPVLQWGSSAAGGGSHWSIASWYVTSGGDAFHTTLVRVEPETVLVGVMRQTGAKGAFDCVSEFEGRANTSLKVQNIAELLWCNETLEAYDVQRCSEYPSSPSTSFRDIALRAGATRTVNWTTVNKVTDCGQHTEVRSNSATAGGVEIFYR